MIWNRFIYFGLSILITTLGYLGSHSDRALAVEFPSAICSKPLIYFDLGQTLVDTETHKYNPMYYLPGAQEYLATLQENGYSLGMIIDIPGDWGTNYPPEDPIKDPLTAKWVRSIDFIQGKVPADGTSWVGPEFNPLDFAKIVGLGASRKLRGNVLLPLKHSERKEQGNPILFVRALKNAKGCPVIYMTETLEHLQLAQKVGVIPYRVGKTTPGKFYLPIEKIPEYVKHPKRF